MTDHNPNPVTTPEASRFRPYGAGAEGGLPLGDVLSAPYRAEFRMAIQPVAPPIRLPIVAILPPDRAGNAIEPSEYLGVYHLSHDRSDIARAGASARCVAQQRVFRDTFVCAPSTTS